MYEGVYALSTALGRPLMAKKLVEAAREVGASAVAHGCTGKGNDQARFDAGIMTLAAHGDPLKIPPGPGCLKIFSTSGYSTSSQNPLS